MVQGKCSYEKLRAVIGNDTLLVKILTTNNHFSNKVGFQGLTYIVLNAARVRSLHKLAQQLTIAIGFFLNYLVVESFVKVSDAICQKALHKQVMP